MRKVIAAAFVSLDGVMQAPGGPEEDPTGDFRFGGWVAPYWDDALSQSMSSLFDHPFDLLLGRKTYDIFAAHWPYAEDTADREVAEAFNKATKYVATSGRGPLNWGPSVALHDAAADVARLKGEDGPDLLIQGSSVLIQTLLAADLIDNIRVLIFPVLLGKGKRLFGEGTRPGALKLENSTFSQSGVTINVYRRCGEVPTGDFTFEEPTEEELARREKMAREV